MGKNLIIKGADFSMNSIEGNGYSGTFYLENGGINIVMDYRFTTGRMIGYDDNQIQKRVRMYLDGTRKPLYVPAGYKMKITGVENLLMDYCIYNHDHFADDFKLTSATTANQYGEEIERTSQQEPVHPYFVDTYSHSTSKTFFSLTDGTANTVTIPASNTGRYFAFVAKNSDNTAINVGEFEITFEVFE